MSRTPTPRDRRYRTSVGAPVDLTAEVEALSVVYPLKRGGQATPDRSRFPEIGPACETTGAQTRSGKRVVVNADTNAGPEIGSTENTKTRQEHRGSARPVRPGRHWTD